MGQAGSKARIGLLLAAIVALLILAGSVSLAQAGPTTVVPQASGRSGDLYFTTFQPPSVRQVAFTYRQGHLMLGRPNVVARPPGADGILFSTGGQLLVGGQNSGNVYSVDPSTGAVAVLASGVPATFHLALSPDGRTVYASGEPGLLGAVPLDPPGSGREIVLHGDDATVTGLAFGPSGQVLYTSSPASGTGSIGTIDLASGATHRLLSGVASHGIVYDPATSSYIVVGGSTVLQLPASDPAKIVSEFVLPGAEFDQGTATGTGQVFLGSNDGRLVFIDYAATKRIGDVADPVVERQLVTNLDDVAPLVGPGTRPIATSAHVWKAIGASLLGLAGALVLGSAGTVLWRRRRNPNRHRPRWDRRSQAFSGSMAHSAH